MGMYRDRQLPAKQCTYFSATSKTPGEHASREEMAHFFLAQRLEEAFGKEPATKNAILHSVTGPLGMSYYETSEVLAEAVKEGYVERVQIRNKE